MSDGGPAETAATATCDVADPAPALAGPPPFARPVPSDGGRPTPSVRPSPFVAPEPGQRDHQTASLGADAASTPGGAGARVTLEPADEPERSSDPRSHPEERSPAVGGEDRGPAPVAIDRSSMAWPDPAEIAAAAALDSVARRLRAGSLRLPVAVNPAYPPAVLAGVLAALHAEGSAAAAPGTAEPRP